MVNGDITVVRCQYDNEHNQIVVTYRLASALPAKPQNFQFVISGADVAALGSNWGDNDLIQALANKYGLTPPVAPSPAPAPATANPANN